MSEKNELERTIEYALNGVPEIKIKEKRKWLGEFRERVVLGLTMQQAQKMEALNTVKEGLRDPMAEMLIVNNNMPIETTAKYMKIAKEMNKEYKSVATEHEEAMGVVLASRSAVDREDVTPEIKELPEKFHHVKHKELCSKCYEELQRLSPEAAKEFKKLSFVDKVIGLYCGACGWQEDGGPLM
ncbi:YueI family protein [Clostridium formicaceticum]|uniref:DUF1694 domain-containing protein n=1 Tax=Clostridium formicaceticum TaxID=1497 RepID=A0AAC9RI32_9CLOT|nr:YueI family protein [Clostridium formicaceticum]AOY75587.1 hypothetical protein BJL90_06580 [Clostridium formicaceticum]ARE85892.1 hypothetical protein CLFO_02080 [Clostridium formicaceticum]